MAFATADDFATRLGVDLTVTEQTDATTLLALATELIQDEVGQTIEEVLNDTLTRLGSWDSRLRLPERPVTNVDSVTLDGTALVEGDEWYVDGDELVRARTLNQTGFPSVDGGGWSGPESELVIVYDHGYATIPGLAKSVCLEMVARVWVNPGGVGQESIGSEQTSYPARYTGKGSEVGGLLILRAEADLLQRKFGRIAGTVTLR